MSVEACAARARVYVENASTHRPDYVKCALLGTFENDKPVRKAWCGRTPETFEFCFEDAGHALLAARAKDRLQLCSGCSAEIAHVLAEGTYKP